MQTHDNEGVQINPNINDTSGIKLVGYARQTPMANQNSFTEVYDIGKNPSTNNAGLALWHAVMGIHASYDFYMYILKKGYVYKNGFKFQKISSIASATPSEWLSNALYAYGTYPANISTPQYWTLPDPALGPVIDSNCNYHPSHDCEKPFTTKQSLYPLGGNQLASYGMKYSPSCALDKYEQSQLNNLGLQGYVYTKLQSDPSFVNGFSNPNILMVANYSPMENFQSRPTWCTYWESVPMFDGTTADDVALGNYDTKNMTIRFDDNSIGNAPVPLYRAEVDINLNAFFNDWLIGNNLIEYKPPFFYLIDFLI